MKVMTLVLEMAALISIAISANVHAAINIQRNAPVAVGETAPEFTLEDENSNKVTLSAARGNSPVVLVFYRGYW